MKNEHYQEDILGTERAAGTSVQAITAQDPGDDSA